MSDAVKLLIGLSIGFLPLWPFKEFRLSLTFFQIDVSTVFICLAAIVGMVLQIKKQYFKINLIDVFVLIWLMYILMLTVLSGGLTVDAIKLFLCIIVYFITRVACSSISNNIKAWPLILNSTILLTCLLFLFYQYFFVFDKNFLGVNLFNFGGESGRNTLAVSMLMNGPLVFGALLVSKKRITKLMSKLSVFIFVLAFLNIHSRGMWVSFIFFTIIISVIIILSKISKKHFKFKSIIKKQSFYLAINMFFIVLILLIYLGSSYGQPIKDRALILFSPHGPDNSAKVRIELIRDSFVVWLNNPFLGVGLGNYVSYSLIGKVTHNDYFALLVEAGIIGFIVFISIIFLVWRKILVNFYVNKFYVYKDYPILVGFGLLTIYMNFNNLISTTVFWIFLACISSNLNISNGCSKRLIFTEKINRDFT